MNTFQDDVNLDLPQMEAAAAPSQAMHGVRALSPMEIKAVAGGPEGSVGSGMNPPNSANSR
jgi:hypothetical protein